MGIGFENIKKGASEIKHTNIDMNTLSGEVKEIVDFLKKNISTEEVIPMISTLENICSLPDTLKQEAIHLIKDEGKTPDESYSIVMEEDDDKLDPDGSRRNKIRRDMGLI